MGENARKPKTPKKRQPIWVGLDPDGAPPDFPYARASTSAIHNQGLFAAQPIPKDASIIQYLGERVTKRESNRRGLAQHDLSAQAGVGSVYIFEIDARHDIDGNFPWNVARLANHSCSPNCEAQNVGGEIWFVALRDIPKGEELTFDYGYALEHWRDHPCRCGSDNCVGHIVRREDWKKLRRILGRQRRPAQPEPAHA